MISPPNGNDTTSVNGGVADTGPVVRRRVLVAGRVQGVTFRQSCRHEADAHRVRGWVQNQPDGSVLAVFEGNAADVAHLIEWCHRGPVAARVRAVYVQEEIVRGDFVGFEVR